MNVLIVYAHPEPKSFNGALKDLAVTVLKEEGHHEDTRIRYLEDYKKRLQNLSEIPPIPYHPSSHYDEHHQLKMEYR